MKRLLILTIALLATVAVSAQRPANAIRALDPKHPIELLDGAFRYEHQVIQLDEHTILIDGSLSDAEAAARPHVYNTFQAAAAHFVAGSEEQPMRVYIAPWVYWIDDPDDPYIRGSKGEYPFGMVVKCPYLHLIGLHTNPRAVVLASQRGQTQGAVGNFTMFDFWGDGMRFENLTMGNFCNIDLEYPLKPELGRPKRNSAITQAHVAYCHGDRIVARNVHFLSRLNMCPLAGAKRILFQNCHMESTDDALCSTGVYLNCTLDFYGQKPFYNTDRGGAIFLGCRFRVCHEEPRQYFCKAQNPLSIINCRFEGPTLDYVGWTHTPAEWLRCYQYRVKMNGQPYIIGADQPTNTITLDDKLLLSAYYVKYRLRDDTYLDCYNIYNLLCGDDGWDPLGQRAEIEYAGRLSNRDYTQIATSLQLDRRQAELRTGEEPLTVTATLFRHCNYPLNNRPIRWRVESGYERYVQLSTTEGQTCTVTPTNDEDYPEHFTLIASTDEGHEAALELTIHPNLIAPPTFTKQPEILLSRQGRADVVYALDLGQREDLSIVTWYRAKRKDGKDAVPVAVSPAYTLSPNYKATGDIVTRLDAPTLAYGLTQDDIGYYLVAGVAPKHIRSEAGEEVRVVTSRPIRKEDVKQIRSMDRTFATFPPMNQPKIAAGWWTVDSFKPADTKAYGWQPNTEKPAWRFGEGINGARGTGLYQIQKGARLLYTPTAERKGDMEVRLYCDPAKTAGQGFGSATGQYMDLYIQFDTKTLTGYALRVERTTKHSNAVDFSLVRYDRGEVTPLTKPISSPCFRTGCILTIKIDGKQLTAHVESQTLLPLETRHLPQQVDLKATVKPLPYGGTGLLYTGSCGESIVLLHCLQVEWNGQ